MGCPSELPRKSFFVMTPNEIPVPKRTRRLPRTPELPPAGGDLRRDYDPRRIQAELFQMFYFHAMPSEVEEMLQQMFELWLGSTHGEMATAESRRRNFAVVNDLCRIVRVSGADFTTKQS